MLICENVKLRGEYDVIVAGGGVAGVAAAVAAGRKGKHVLLIEKSTKLGGLATLGLINLFVPMCNGKGKQVIKGLAEEMLRLAIRYGYNTLPEDFLGGEIPEDKLLKYSKAGKKPPRYMSRFSADIFALALTELCVDSNVEIMFDSLVTKVVKSNDDSSFITGLVVENKSGSCVCCGRMYVDATGDADILRRVGVPIKRRGAYHTYMGMKIDLSTCATAIEKKNIGFATKYICAGKANLYGKGHPADMPLYDGTDDKDINRYIIQNQIELLRELGTDPAFTDIVALPGMVQFRTSCCIEGNYTLCETDVNKHYPDSIGAICDFDRRGCLFEIPFGTLVHDKYSNVITAGRTASADGYAWDVLRVIPPAIITGQAAGTACVHAIDEDCSINEIDVFYLQEDLASQGVLIHFDDNDADACYEDEHESNDSCVDE